MTGDSPSPGMVSKSVGMGWTLLQVEMIGELSNQLMKARVESSIQVSGPVPGCPLISVEVGPVILMALTSASPTFAFQALLCKVPSLKNAQALSLRLLPRHLQVLPRQRSAT